MIPSLKGRSGGTQPVRNINPNARTTVELFNGKYYKEWSYSEKMASDGAKCLGYINGRINEPSKEDSNYEVRESENMLLMNWILNFMELLSSQSFRYCKTAYELRNAIEQLTLRI